MPLWDWKVPLLGENPIIFRSYGIASKNQTDAVFVLCVATGYIIYSRKYDGLVMKWHDNTIGDNGFAHQNALSNYFSKTD